MMIDCRQMEDLPPTNRDGSSKQSDIPLVVYHQVGPFFKEGTPAYCRRLSGIGSLLHKLTLIPGLKEKHKLGAVSVVKIVRVKRETVKLKSIKLQGQMVMILKRPARQLEWAGTLPKCVRFVKLYCANTVAICFIPNKCQCRHADQQICRPPHPVC